MKATKLVAGLMVSAMAVGGGVSALAAEEAVFESVPAKSLVSAVTIEDGTNADKQEFPLPDGVKKMMSVLLKTADKDGKDLFLDFEDLKDTVPQDGKTYDIKTEDGSEIQVTFKATPTTEAIPAN